MRKVISACLVLVIVFWVNVGEASQRNGRRGSSSRQSRGLQIRGGGQQWQSQRNANPRRSPALRGRQGQTGEVAITGPLSSAETESLIHMRQEEKLARDVYRTLGEKWNLPVFANISKAESRHMAAIGNLLARYNIPDPVANDVRGKFADQRFTKMYRDLVSSGTRSVSDSLRVGVQVEKLDITDLRANINATQQQDIRRVYQHLLKGSQQHLRAFTAQLR